MSRGWPYKAIPITRNHRPNRCRSSRHSASDRCSLACLLAATALRPGAGAGHAQNSGEPGARHADGAQARGGRTASRARLLGPAASAGAAGSFAYLGHPLPDRDRLSAVQLHRRRRQSGRLQCRSRALAVRGDQGHLHHPDAPLRDAARRHLQQPGRCHHRLDGRDRAAAHPPRFHRSLLPRAGALRVAARRRVAGSASRISRGQEGRRRHRLRA